MAPEPHDYGKLRPEFKAEWVRRLRSGNYQQGVAYLRQNLNDGTLLCCLGVACEIAVDQGVVDSGATLDAPAGLSFTAYGEDGDTTLPPLKLRAWAYEVLPSTAWQVPHGGIDYEGTEVEPEPTDLADLNDDYNLTFAEIADLIEEYL